jgi:hypothetical protein
VIQRRTQTAEYWQEEFALVKKDEAFLYDQILEGGKPVPTAVLAEALIGRHCRQEEDLIEAELSKGEVYQPKDEYEVGAPIIFPVFEYVLGTVVGTRPGKSPEHGEFTVIQVEFEGDDEAREFASALQGEHRLNRTHGEAEILVSAELSSPQELHKQYGASVEAKIATHLEAHADFVNFGGDWFLQDLLVPIDEGYLNIAEALVEIKGMPQTTAEFLPELDLPAEVSEEIRTLSLSCALEADGRFDNIGDMGRDLWYLRRLTPATVVNPPSRLVIEDIDYDRGDISDELLLIEREVDDEGSGEDVMGPSRPIYRTTIALTYSHWRSGTLPLTVRTRGLFPQASNHHTPIVLVDGQSGSRTQGWVVHEESFVYGLADWYQRYSLPVGAFIRLERTRDPRVIHVDFEARRLKRLWAVVATVTGRDLTFEMRKLPVACEYDAQLMIGEDRHEAIDRIWEEVHARRESLLQTMVGMMPKLTSLSPQGTVHAKTIYSAVNVMRRVAPGPVFALLSSESCFVPMGGGYWTFDEALV